MPLLAGTGQQALIALLCFMVGLLCAPLYEFTRPLKRKSLSLEVALDLFFMLAAGGIFLLFTHTVLKGILSFYTAMSFLTGACVGAYIIRKTSHFFIRLIMPLITFLKTKLIVSEKAPKSTKTPIKRLKKIRQKV